MGDIKKYQLEYIDIRKIIIPQLEFYSNGIKLPKDDNKIFVNEKEKNSLLKMKNGDKPCFKEIRERERKVKEEEVKL